MSYSYTATLTPTVSGVYTVHVSHTSTPIVHSPFSATIEAGIAEASACVAALQKYVM
jgi:hypothetical protein